MTTLTIKLGVLALAVSGSIPTIQAAGPIVQRQTNQQARIAQGVRTGALTRVETSYIERRENQLAREIRRDRIDGGGLTPLERTRIDAKQDSLSRQIYGLKHNGRVR